MSMPMPMLMLRQIEMVDYTCDKNFIVLLEAGYTVQKQTRRNNRLYEKVGDSRNSSMSAALSACQIEWRTT